MRARGQSRDGRKERELGQADSGPGLGPRMCKSGQAEPRDHFCKRVFLLTTSVPPSRRPTTGVTQHGFCEANTASESVSASYHTCALRSCIALQAKLATRAWQTRHLSARACAQNRGRRCRTLSPLLLQHPRRLIVSVRHAIRQQRPRRRSRPTHGRVSTARTAWELRPRPRERCFPGFRAALRLLVLSRIA